MSLLPEDPALARLVGRLAPYARATLERAAEHALRLHAEEITPEHLLTALLRDEVAGGTRLVLHAFADPETLADEVQALSPGVMVVGARRTLPFSVRGVQALERSLPEARGTGADEVVTGHVFHAAWRRLGEDETRALERAGARVTLPVLPSDEAPPPADAPLLRHFSNDARRALGASCRLADRWGRDAIGPVHLLAGTLETDGSLRRTTGLTVVSLQAALAGRDADETPLERRPMVPDAALALLLGELADGADTLALLGWFLTRGSPELRELLRRQKITAALHASADDAFEDPSDP